MISTVLMPIVRALVNTMSVLVSAVMVVVIMGLSTAAMAHAQTFEVFITEGEVQTHKNTTVYHLKQGDSLMASINQQMELDGVMDEKTGAAYVTQQLQDVLIAQMSGLTKAAQYRLKYFPAIVKDGKYVIYGVTNPKAFNGIAH